MPDAAENRLTASLTMCRKAGKLLLGFDAVKEAAQQKQVKLFLLAADASAKTEKEIRFFAGTLPVRKLPFDMDALKEHARILNPDLDIFVTSARTGEGMDEVAAWLSEKRKQLMAV